MKMNSFLNRNSFELQASDFILRAGLYAGVALVFRPPTAVADRKYEFEVKN